MKHEIFLEFCIWNFEDISASEITSAIGIEPKKVYVKGEKHTAGLQLVSKHNGWTMGSTLSEYDSFEDHLNVLLDILESKFDVISNFAERYECEISCAVYIRYNNDQSIPWIHLPKRYNDLAKQLNIEFDLDIYCLPNE